METASRVAKDRQRFRKRHLGSDELKRICSEMKQKFKLVWRDHAVTDTVGCNFISVMDDASSNRISNISNLVLQSHPLSCCVNIGNLSVILNGLLAYTCVFPCCIWHLFAKIQYKPL